MVYLGEVGTSSITTFVETVIGGITSNIDLTTVAAVVAAIIGAGIVSMFAWKFGRKGFAFIKNALSGRGGKI